MNEETIIQNGKVKLRIRVPESLKVKVLEDRHGSRVNGHRGVQKTMELNGYDLYFGGQRMDVSHRVQNCAHCCLNSFHRPEKHATMIRWHSLRRFPIVAIDILEASSSFGIKTTKAAAIGNLLSRFIWAASIKYEPARTVGKVILDEYALR